MCGANSKEREVQMSKNLSELFEGTVTPVCPLRGCKQEATTLFRLVLRRQDTQGSWYWRHLQRMPSF